MLAGVSVGATFVILTHLDWSYQPVSHQAPIYSTPLTVSPSSGGILFKSVTFEFISMASLCSLM